MLQFQRVCLGRRILTLNFNQYHNRNRYMQQLFQLKKLLRKQPYLSCFHPCLTNSERLCTGVALNQLEEKNLYQSVSRSYDDAVLLDDLETSDLILISERFNLKGLNIQYIHKYNIKVSADLNTVIFPFDSLKKEFAGIQLITYKKDIIGERLVSDSSPKSSNEILFGWSLVGQNQKEIIVTSDPLDAVAINQETDLPAVSLPLGFQRFTPEVFSALKSFAKVIFWLNPDLHNWATHKEIGNSLGKSAFIIRPQDYPSGLHSLQCGSNIKHILDKAYRICNEDLVTFDSYVDIVHDNIKGHEKNSGLKWKRFFPLNELLKGHRRGELTIFSGQTGTGKTTFMSEYSLDLCIQGLPTLWASFEITNARLMQTMLTQFSKCSLVDNIEAYGHCAEEFRKIPMFFLEFRGPRNLDEILKAMRDAVFVYNVRHIVIDNLQFMMNMDIYNTSLDQLRRQDQIFGAFRTFSCDWKCHLTLVIHPRKEPELTELSNTSISGTAKATQEADNILILQTTKNRQYLQVTKNRFDGRKGSVILEFDKKTEMFTMKNMSSKAKDKEQATIL